MKGNAAAWLVGLGGTAVATLGCVLLGDRIDETITALVLLLPVMAASAMATWRVGLAVALVAGVAYGLTFLSPIGRLRIGLTRDVVMIATFVLVALAVSLVTGRVDRARDDAAPSGRDDEVVLRAAAHDLRNPLSTIRAASTDLLNAPDDPRYRAELLSLVASESERLDRIVGNLLSADRLRAGRLTPLAAAEPLGDLLRRSADRTTRVLGRPVVVDADPALPDVMVDATLVDQVVTNLVENAATASPDGAPVTLTAARAGAFAEVAVVDRGPGFPLDHRDELFEIYRSSTGSSGLGLAVCKAIVEAHGGRIGISDAGDGGRIWFTLPLAAAGGAARRDET